MSDPTIAAVLSRVSPFAEAGPAARAAATAGADRRRLGAGEHLFREGDPGGFVFVVEDGTLEVRKSVPGGRQVLLRLMGAGEVGGLTSTTTGSTRSASLCARGAATVITIPADLVLDLLGQHRELLQAVVAYLSGKVRAKTTRLAALLGEGVEPGRVPVAFFDAKTYDREAFDRVAAPDLAPRYLEVRLGPATAVLAEGFRAVCAFVNDDLGAETLERLAASGVELVALRCSGVNQVDLEAAQRLGLAVTRVPAYSPHAIAEHALALVLTLNRKLHRAYNRVREGNFSLAGLVGFDLHGRTAGVVGAGAIGRRLAEILVGMGMSVLVHDPYLDRDWAAAAGVEPAQLDDLLARSDVISLHAPLTPETFHLLDRDRFARMRRGAMLVNTSRGALVDTAALVDALKSGHLGAAGLDVYEEESEYFFEDRSDRVITDDVLARLMTFPNVVVTSHQAFLTEDALATIASTTADSIRRFLRGERLEHAVVHPGRG